MRVTLLSALLLALFATGCSRSESPAPSASPQTSDKASCEAAGGQWQATTQRCVK